MQFIGRKSRIAQKVVGLYPTVPRKYKHILQVCLTLPLVDPFLWLVVVLFLGCSAEFLSPGVLQEWQNNKVVMELKELPVEQLDFPAFTICSDGLNMDAVEKVVETDFEEFKKKQRVKRDDVQKMI